MSKREDRAKDLAAANATSKVWAHMSPTEKDKYRAQATREGFTDDVDPTNAADVVQTQMRGRLDDLAILVGTAEGKGEGWADPDDLKALGVEECHATEDNGRAAGEADERLSEYPLCVETTTTFEIVIGTGGPDDRILIECDAEPQGSPGRDMDYEIRRVLYRFSWEGSAEVELSGEDRRVAEAFARRVVPELIE